MTESTEEIQQPGEIYVNITYEAPNECAFYGEIRNGFRSAFWTTPGYSAAIMFINIPGNSLLPGQTKRVLAYTLNAEFSKQLLSSEKVYWGPASCSFGTLKLETI